MRGDSTLILDAQRRLARTILVGLVSAIVAFVLFASGPNIGLSFAQQQTPGYSIQFLNPSGFNEEVSAQNDGTNSTYHLVAWINQIPANVGVVFAYRDSAGNVVEIGPGTQTGIPDTFDLQWDPGALRDTGGTTNLTLIAILYSGENELARDTESDITLNDETPDPQSPNPNDQKPRGSTIEMTYPADGGAFGFFTPRDRAASGVIEATVSEDTFYVDGYYTVSAPGTEPNWVECADNNIVGDDADDGIRCTLSSQHEASEVTAVAVESSDDIAFDSGDAHRIAPYDQVPTNYSVNPASQSVGSGQCSAPITATLTDQNQIPIAGANVDAHAQGPTDTTYFGSGHQPPDQGHGKEPAANCSTSPPGTTGQQGDHENTQGNDVKHIESTPSGTSDDGQWTFRVYSPSQGDVHFTTWVDRDENDVFCSAEVNASGAVGFQQGAPGIVGIPAETSDCPMPTPTNTSPGPTTPGPTPSDSESPDPRGCTQTGTDDSEEIQGTPEDDVICAGAGNDIVRGLGGNDVIYGDEGRDDLRGGIGKDKLHGGSDKDTLRGNGAADSLFGDAHNDVITGGGGNDLSEGGSGADTIRGSGGADDLMGSAGNDAVTGGTGNDLLGGGRGRDVLQGGSGRDTCNGGGGRDSVEGCET